MVQNFSPIRTESQWEKIPIKYSIHFLVFPLSHCWWVSTYYYWALWSHTHGFDQYPENLPPDYESDIICQTCQTSSLSVIIIAIYIYSRNRIWQKFVVDYLNLSSRAWNLMLYDTIDQVNWEKSKTCCNCFFGSICLIYSHQPSITNRDMSIRRLLLPEWTLINVAKDQ